MIGVMMDERISKDILAATKTIAKGLANIKVWLVVLGLLTAFSMFQWWAVEKRLQTLERQMFYRAKFEERVKAELDIGD